MAEAFGVRGVKAKTPDSIREAVTAGLASREVTVIHVPIVGGNPQVGA
jgi:thiamine pyrophosphate-dependent acetolactate synthase large subunit-like protein